MSKQSGPGQRVVLPSGRVITEEKAHLRPLRASYSRTRTLKLPACTSKHQQFALNDAPTEESERSSRSSFASPPDLRLHTMYTRLQPFPFRSCF